MDLLEDADLIELHREFRDVVGDAEERLPGSGLLSFDSCPQFRVGNPLKLNG